MSEAVIVAATRTPIGRARKGSLVDARPDDLVGFAIDSALKQVPKLDRGEIVDVMVGCGFPQERQGMNLGRRAALLAGLPDTVPGTTVNRFCASSLQTIRMAFHAIRAGEGDAYVAAGVESITQVDGYPKDSEELHPKLFGDDPRSRTSTIPMGLTAENVAERWDSRARTWTGTRSAPRNGRSAAQDFGFPSVRSRPGDSRSDEVHAAARRSRRSPRPRRCSSRAAKLPPGRVPARRRRGCCRSHVTRSRRARDLGLKPPRRSLIASSVSGVEPEIMGRRPQWGGAEGARPGGDDDEDVDVMELNEAFAAQVLPVCS